MSKWAVLIGIEHYLIPGQPPTTPRLDGLGRQISYDTLEGCVNDVLAVEKYLVETLGIPHDHIEKLLAPRPKAQYIGELDKATYAEATYSSIVQALRRIPQNAQKGDFVYIHYSGHGARATTVFPDAREKDPSRSDKDEALVPSDILYGGRYLRDLELAVLMQEMASAGLIVTASLDCCHSGGALRGEDGVDLVRFRGVSGVYVSDPDSDTPDRETMDRIAHWASQPRWFTSPRGFVVMTACLDTQPAAEHHSGHGLFTYWMLHSLCNGPLDMSSNALFERIRSHVEGDRYNQTPQMFGDPDRFFFSSAVRSRVYAHAVSRTELHRARRLKDQYVVLNGGRMHGIERGSEYAILKFGHDLALGAPDDAVLARVRVVRVKPRESYATLVAVTEGKLAEISAGCPAVLLRLPLARRFVVRFRDPGGASGMLDDLREAWRRHQSQSGRTWLELKEGKGAVDTGGDGDAAFSVSVENGKFMISDTWGTFTPALNACLSPLPATTSDEDIAALIRRLEHLARFAMTRGLCDPVGLRSGVPLLSITAVQPAPEPRLLEGSIDPWLPAECLEEKVKHRMYDVEEQGLVSITFHNNTTQALYLVVLICGAEFGVEQAYPVGPEDKRIAAGQNFTWAFGFQAAPEIRRAAEEDGREVVDRIKAFASPSPISLGALQLESLVRMERMQFRGTRGGDWSQDFQELLAELESMRGGVGVSPTAAEEPIEWQIVDVLFRLKLGVEQFDDDL